jgi:hypothetical protein
MRKVAIAFSATIAFVIAGGLAWNAQAASLAGTAPAMNYSPVEKVACGGPGPNCPWGRTWVCGPHRCWCAPCGGRYYGAPYVYPLRPWRWRY